MRDQKYDGQRNSGEAVGRAKTQDRTQNSAHKNANAVNDPGRVEEPGDENSEKGAERSSDETLPGQRPGGLIVDSRITIVEIGAQ